MTWWMLVTSAWLLGMGALHLLFGELFARFLRRTEAPVPEGGWPRVAVLLSLRGADPFLEQTLRALADLDYPALQVSIVIDHASDPAWEQCQAILQKMDSRRLRMAELEERFESCSLKCSALIQAVQHLDDEVEVVVLADADVVPYRSWLKELVGPLRDPRVGATTGQQWFVPSEADLGSYVRTVWNAGAIVPTAWLGHPWAGSCALRREDLLRANLLDRWRNSIVDDGPIADALQSLGLKVQFVPTVLMLNREKCSFAFCWAYMRRMLTWSRLYEGTYPLTVLHAMLLELPVLLAIGLLFTAALLHPLAAGLLGFALLTFWVANVVSLKRIEQAVRLRTHDRKAAWPPRTWRHELLLWLAVPLTHFIYAVSAIRACFTREITWREITYRVDRAGRAHMLAYAPYRGSARQEAEMSL